MSVVSRDGIDLLLEFHDEVRSHLADLRELEEGLIRDEESIGERAREVASSLHKCLRDDLVLHERDEVESLLPRVNDALARRDDAEPTLVAELEAVEQQHAGNEGLWRRIRPWLLALYTPDATVSLADFSPARRSLERHLLTHFELEETVIYPAARRLLSEDELLMMAEEIVARRQRPDRAS
jgi:hemerythrin-like domain-containing protein